MGNRLSMTCVYALSACLFVCTLAEAKVVYVDHLASGSGDGSSWTSALKTVGAGIAAATAGDEVWVRAGMYPEGVDIARKVALRGSFNGTETDPAERDLTGNRTILDAAGLERPVIDSSAETLIDGLTLTNGTYGLRITNATFTAYDSRFIDNAEVGIYANRTSTALVRCILLRNGAYGVYCRGRSLVMADCSVMDSGSYGIYAGSSSSSYTITRCVVSGSNATGCRIDSFKSFEMADSRIADNRSLYESGLLLEWNAYTVYEARITDCTFEGNVTGPYNSNGALSVPPKTVISGCLIRNNTGSGIHGSPTLINCLIYGNRSRNGGAITGAPTIINCTIVNNSATLSGGGAWHYTSGRLIVKNSILWNAGEEITGGLIRDASVANSCIQGGWPGEGNTDVLPQFVDEVAGDFRLANGSPCIDGGNSAVAPPADRDGVLRMEFDSQVDIGAYETPPDFESGPKAHLPVIHYVNINIPAEGDGRSPETAFRAIETALRISSTSDEIRVAPGSYKSRITLEPRVTLQGGIAATRSGRTVIEPIDRPANQWATCIISGANGAVIDSFVIRNSLQAGSSSLVYCAYSSPTLRNCEITGGTGDGITCIQSSPLLINCTLAGLDGYPLRISNATPQLVNCILWNRKREIFLEGAGSADIRYSNVQGGWPGEGNISAWPSFRNESDYHLAADSPCIDAGLPDFAPSHDLEGSIRPGADNKVDMGAYESDPENEPGPISPPRVLHVRKNAAPGGDGSTWSKAFQTINKALAISTNNDSLWVA